VSLTVTPITPQPITAWLISTATAGDVVVALNTVAPIGWHGTVTTAVQPNTDPPYVVWNILLTRTGYPDLKGTNGSWIVFDGNHVDILTNADFIANYTADIPLVWDATTHAPDAAPQSGGTVHINCPAPTSANGPWTYSIRLVDSGGDATEHTERPTLTNGQLSWTIDGLSARDQYTGTITCDTQHPGIEADSVSFTFTAEA
jgi:hypothetical protein